jgi:hypothetical protein
MAVDLETLVPASAPAPSGHSFSRFAAVGGARTSRDDHLHIGQQVVAEGHRLGRLQMGEARHQHVRRAPPPGSGRAAAPAKPGRMLRSSASRTQRRKSVTTWSLRERAVCSRPASLADQAGQPASTFMWMSSSTASGDVFLSHPPVNIEGGVDFFHYVGRGRGKPSSPHRLAFATGHWHTPSTN